MREKTDEIAEGKTFVSIKIIDENRKQSVYALFNKFFLLSISIYITAVRVGAGFQTNKPRQRVHSCSVSLFIYLKCRVTTRPQTCILPLHNHGISSKTGVSLLESAFPFLQWTNCLLQCHIHLQRL